MERTIHVETELAADADRVWSAMQHPASFRHVIWPVLAVPALSGRTDPVREGEVASGWLLFLSSIPVWRHTIHVVEVDGETRTIRTEERGGPLTRWDHVLHVEPTGPGRSRYSDTVTLDAGPLTASSAAIATALYRYRQARGRRLARRHLADRSALAA